MKAISSANADAVYEGLASRIRDGVWPLGCTIPNEEKLCAMFSCSRYAIAKAVARLVHEKMVERKTRAGTTVIGRLPGRESRALELDAFALIYPSDQHEGIRRIAQGFQDEAHLLQRRVVALSTGTDFDKEGEIIGRLDEFDVKGALVYPVLPEARVRVRFEQMLLNCRFPVVLSAPLPGFGCSSVSLDGSHAGWTMTRHLLGRGLKRIGFLSNYAWTQAIRERYLGYRWAMEGAGHSIQAGWVMLDPCLHANFGDPLAEGRLFTMQYLRNAIECGLEGVVCGDDFIALNCLASARELGISVPDQFKVVGIADYSLSAQSDPALTTYREPFEEIGRRSLHVLNQLVQGGDRMETETHLRGELVVRQSG